MIPKRPLIAALVALLLASLPAAAPAQPVARDALTIAQFVDPPNLDPYNTTAPYISVFAQICEPLIYWDSDSSGNAIIKKLLATDYRWLDDTRLQFKLRPGVRFSNGEPFNAAAVKFSLEQLFAAFNYSQWLKDLLKEVTVVDDTTVVLALTKPAGYVVSSRTGASRSPPRTSRPAARTRSISPRSARAPGCSRSTGRTATSRS